MASDEQIHNAEQDYVDGMKYKDIAAKYSVSINTVKSWRKRHGWTRSTGAPKTAKRVHPKTRGAPAKIANDLEANGELNDKQKLFCLFYLQSFNATSSYQRAYEVDHKTAMASGSRMLSNVKVQAEISKLRTERQKSEFISAQDVLHELKRQAFANIGDIVDVETKQIPVVKYGRVMMNPQTGDPITYTESSVRFHEQSEVDMSQIQGVHIDKGEVIVELPDKQRALLELLKHLEPEDAGTDATTIVDDLGDEHADSSS
ncbi:terminase [Furfurilactobacillus rossiae]|uniref:terminase small subunit n=1 Tax=Furfurilactobacillus rossiae TaxID=231049 RepID=UPI0015B9AD73|nr:terminase small subunit [Furfurilactobacillus rossiae]QLE64000.1 terminase [Furfurilactobacillus rossiae]